MFHVILLHKYNEYIKMINLIASGQMKFTGLV